MYYYIYILAYTGAYLTALPVLPSYKYSATLLPTTHAVKYGRSMHIVNSVIAVVFIISLRVKAPVLCMCLWCFPVELYWIK